MVMRMLASGENEKKGGEKGCQSETQSQTRLDESLCVIAQLSLPLFLSLVTMCRFFAIFAIFAIGLVCSPVCGLAGNATDSGNGTQPTLALCPEGYFLDSVAPGATCTSCDTFRMNDPIYACDRDDSFHCCGSYGCGTYVENAIGSSACFKRAMDASVNVAAPSAIGVVLLLLLLGSCVCIDKNRYNQDNTNRTRVVFFQLAYLLCTLTHILVLVATLTYPVQLQADYSAITGTQTALLTCVPPFVIQVMCGVLAISFSCASKHLHGFACSLVGCTASLLGLAAFFLTVHHPNGLVPLIGVDGKTITAHLELDPQYQFWGLFGFACFAHGLLWFVCALRLLLAACAKCTCPVRVVRVSDHQVNVDGHAYGLLASAPVYVASDSSVAVASSHAV
jgi:hypothetical protein